MMETIPKNWRREVTLVERAKELAHRAHVGQVDKAGRPYIEHVARVAAAVADDPDAEAVAWLHDVWEDHPDFENGQLPRWLPIRLLAATQCLNRRNAKDNPTYYAIVSNDPIALRVKLADIADNADETRLALLDSATADRLRKKYARAREALTVGSNGGVECWCSTCRPITLEDCRMVLCPDCGNKRCPKANDHRNACSGSNEPGQAGSAYP